MQTSGTGRFTCKIKSLRIEEKMAHKTIEELDYNVNYKLWLDSMFAKLIGGGSND